MTTMESPASRAVPRRGAGLRQAGARAIGALPAAFGFALAWSAAVAGLVVASLWWREAGWTDRTRDVLGTFVAGAALGGVLAVAAAAAVAGHRAASARFAAMLAGLVACTGGGVLFVYALQFRLADPDFWWDFPSAMFVVEFVFTMASAAYVLMVSGLPLLLPHGLPLLFVAAWWFARHPRG